MRLNLTHRTILLGCLLAWKIDASAAAYEPLRVLLSTPLAYSHIIHFWRVRETLVERGHTVRVSFCLRQPNRRGNSQKAL